MIELTRAMTLVLIILAKGERHGYAIMSEIADMIDSEYRVGAGTLYRSIHQLVSQDLIQEAPELFDPEFDDSRRTYYRIMPEGRAALEAELRRIEKLLMVARSIIPSTK